MITLHHTHSARPPLAAVKVRPIANPEGRRSQYETILDSRTAQRELRQWLDQNESWVLRALLALWDSERDLFSTSTVRDAIASGQIPAAWLAEFERDYSRFVNQTMVPQWAGALGAGTLIEAGVPGWTWQGGTQWLSSYTRDHGGQLITRLVAEQAQAIRATLYHYVVEDPVSGIKLAQILRPMVGVTEQSALRAIRLREELVAAGLKPEVIEKRVFNYLRRANARRAETIARTELATAWHSAQMTSMREAIRAGNIVGRVFVTWDAAPDELVCPICSDLDGKNVWIGEEFTATIQRGRGDDRHDVEVPVGMQPPAHINCVLPGNEVVCPDLVAATKAFYVGGAVEVTTASGRMLSVTENHPVLTTRGWTPAALLSECDNLIAAVDVEGITSAINPHDQHIPTKIEEVFCSLVEGGAVSTATVPATAEDFHGDGIGVDGDVQVVLANGALLGDRDPSLNEPVCELGFDRDCSGEGEFDRLGSLFALFNRGLATANRFMRRAGEALALFLGGPRHAFEHGGATSTRLDISFTDDAPDRFARDLQSLRDALLGLPSKVSGTDVATIEPNAPVWISALSPSQGDSGLVEPPIDAYYVDAQLARDFCDRFAGMVEPDRILKVRRFQFRGHVYDLQSSLYRLYICGGVVVHNCRCTLVYRTDIGV